MRWSLFSLYLLLSVVIVNVIASPVPLDPNQAALERRGAARKRPTTNKLPAVRKLPATRKLPAARKLPATRKLTASRKRPAATKRVKSLNAAAFKKPSATYRKNALKSKNPMFYINSNGKLVPGKTGGKMPKGYDADHIVEAQVVSHAVKEAGHTPASIEPAKEAITAILNGPDNMAFTPPAMNRAKGRYYRQAIMGKTPKRQKKKSTNRANERYKKARASKPPIQLHRQTQEYLKSTREAGLKTSQAIDAAVEKLGLQPINLEKNQRELYKVVTGHKK